MAATGHFTAFILKTIAPVLRELGFDHKDDMFYLRREGNVALVEFQKSRESKPDAILFTVNLGILSSRLLEFFSDRSPSSEPLFDQCHWQMRLGFLMPEQQDKWWTLTLATDTEILGQELASVLHNIAMPVIEQHIRDEALRDLWLSGQSPGLTDIQRLMNLSVLLRIHGPQARLGEIIQELRRASANKPSALMVEHHIQVLLPQERTRKSAPENP